MNQTALKIAESHFRPAAAADKVERLARIRDALKTRERALKIVEREMRLQKRAATHD